MQTDAATLELRFLMSEPKIPATEPVPFPAAHLAPGAWERDLTLFVACYNEEENVADTLDALTAALAECDFSWEIIVGDDGSTDRTAEVAQRYIQEHPGLPIYCKANKQNRGLAQCYVDTAFLGRGKYYRLICGDNAEPKETFVTIFKHLGEADMIIPYHAELRGKSLFRRVLSKAYTWIVNAITGRRIRYYNGMAIHLRYNVMRWHPDTRGFGFQAELICRLLDEGFSYIEVPVMAHERTKGHAKAITVRNFCSVAHTLLELVIRRLSRMLYGRAAATRPADRTLTPEVSLPPGEDGSSRRQA